MITLIDLTEKESYCPLFSSVTSARKLTAFSVVLFLGSPGNSIRVELRVGFGAAA